MKSLIRVIGLLIAVIITASLISCSGAPSPYVGRVNQRNITTEEYTSALRQQFEMYMLNTGVAPDNTVLGHLMDRAWYNIVDGAIFQENLQKYNISVTYQEVIEHLKDNVPQIVKESGHFRDGDSFDTEKYHSSLTENEPIELAWLVRRYYEVELPRIKLEQRLFSLIDIPERDIRQRFNVLNGSANAVIIGFLDESFNNVIVSQPEIRDYYERNRSQYLLEPYASLNYLIIPLKPSGTDSLRTKTIADSVHTELRDGIDFRMMANVKSDGPTANQGGELPFVEYIELSRNVRMSVENLSSGEITRPFQTPDGWVIYQVMTKTRNMVKLREIFIAHKASAGTRTSLLDEIIDIRDLALEIGLVTTAEEIDMKVYSVDNLSPGNTTIPVLGKSNSIFERAINSADGTVFEPRFREDLQAYIIIEVIESQAREFKSLSAVSDDIYAILKSTKQSEAAYKAAKEFSGNHSLKNIVTQAKLRNYPVYEFDYFTANSNISGEQDIEPIVIEMFSPAKNRYVTEPVKLKKGTYIGVVNRFNNPDMSDYERQRDIIRTILMEDEKDTFYKEWLQEQIENARVRDWRNRVMTP